MKPVMHLKVTSEILYCGFFFSPEASGVGTKQRSLSPVFIGHRSSCSIVCPCGPGAIFFFSEESESLDRSSIYLMV